MLRSILLNLPSSRSQPVVRLAVELARQARAKLRGVSIQDERPIEAALAGETALRVVQEQSRHRAAGLLQKKQRARLSLACVEAGVDFDVRRIVGEPIEVLRREARFHDLLIVALRGDSETGGLTLRDAFELFRRGAQPLLVARHEQRAIRRVLLAYDGSLASGRAIRGFLNGGLFGDAEHRLLAVGADEAQVRLELRELAEYCAEREVETGLALGKPAKLLPSYAEQWDADLVVWGSEPGGRAMPALFGDAARDVWRKLPCALYAAA